MLPTFDRKTDAIKHYGEELDWKVETDEFFDIENVGGYQTADDADVDVFPAPITHQTMLLEQPMANMEETYYWFLNFLRHDLGYPQIDKIYDIFNTSEGSQMMNVQGQKLSVYQDKASQFLQGIGQMVKQLFQIVRELRIIDERLEPYATWDESKSASDSLKHTYISLVEGGGQNPDSVYSLAQQVGFTVLPDLFFGTNVHKLDDIDKELEKGQMSEFNNVVKTVLRRKLYQFINWKIKTERELHSRRKFQLKYLRQHWKVIQLYMSWVKPYLRHARRMQQDQGALNSAEMISPFDTTAVDIEILAKKPVNPGKGDGHYKCILANFKFTRRPMMPKDNPQMQGMWTGRMEVNLRSYGWHQEDITAYKKLRQSEDIESLKAVDEHIGGAFEALGEEFENYLEEAGEEFVSENKRQEKKKKEEKASAAYELDKEKRKLSKYGPLEPFIEVGNGFGELFKSFFVSDIPKPKKEEVKNRGSGRDKGVLKGASKGASIEMNILYTVYKKSHGLLAW
jgi:hypothetical protein